MKIFFAIIGFLSAMITAGCVGNGDNFVPVGDTGGEVTTEDYLQSRIGYDAVLTEHVDENGRVNYSGLQEGRDLLDTYVKAIAGVRFNNYYEANDNLTDNDRLAFWINVYNALTLKLIIDNYPVDSILNLGGCLPWDVFKFTVGGQTMTLNNIEHDIIRNFFQEPRIHFAINCASVSCPKLRRTAYTGENMDAELEEAAETFANDETLHVIIDPQENSAQLNVLMQWYQADFGPDFGRGRISDVIDFLVLRIDNREKADFLADFPAASVRFIPYDWSLNEE